MEEQLLASAEGWLCQVQLLHFTPTQFLPRQPWEVGFPLIPTFQMRKLRHTQIGSLAKPSDETTKAGFEPRLSAGRCVQGCPPPHCDKSLFKVYVQKNPGDCTTAVSMLRREHSRKRVPGVCTLLLSHKGEHLHVPVTHSPGLHLGYPGGAEEESPGPVCRAFSFSSLSGVGRLGSWRR